MMLQGVAVSPGVVVASAFCLEDELKDVLANCGAADVTVELARFESACEATGRDLRGLIERVSSEIGQSEARIFQSHLFMLRDRAFVGKVKGWIVEHSCTADRAVEETLGEYEEMFASLADPYLRERIVDLRDVAARVNRHLTQPNRPALAPSADRVILVARELLPSQTVAFDGLKLAGLATEKGGGTSHAAIIARSLGVPAVSGVHNLLSQVRTGDVLVLDGRKGTLLVNPGPEAEAAFRKLEREYFDLKDYKVENQNQRAVTLDGVEIEMMANVNSAADAQMAAEVGAVGVGLFRTEYLFMTHPSVPSEQEQFETYCQVRDASPGRLLTIRTLDLGGDKTVPYLGDASEANPFLGWRSIRLSLDHPEFFTKQLRAILRAGAEGDVRMMFPMITNIWELRRVRRMVLAVRRQLAAERAPHMENPAMGVMVEVPAAALCIDHLLDHAQFVSIGANDLAQYITAADRDNPNVAHLCDPLTPAVLKMIDHVIATCNARGVSVSICGEMAGRPRCVLALLAFGIRQLSMSPAFIPLIKDLIHSVSLKELATIRQTILQKHSARLVRKYLTGVLRHVNPRLAMLELS